MLGFTRRARACALAGVVTVFVSSYATAQTSGYQVGVVPPDPVPNIPPGDDIILYIHGGPGSRLEEAGDIANPLIYAGLQLQTPKHYTVISLDQPSQGYSRMVDHTAIVPPHDSNNYYPLVAFNENVIVAFVNQLSRYLPLANHNIYAMGGSTGGAMTMRLGRQRFDTPWLKKIVVWNAASTWTTYANDVIKGLALNQGFGRAVEDESDGSRKGFIDGMFGPPIPWAQWNLHIQPNPEEWYRGNRFDYQSDQDTKQPYFRPPWGCKWQYIRDARMEQQEIYNPIARRWHWRLGTEVLIYSIFNDSWVGPANTAPDDAVTPNYQKIVRPTLLVASDDDDWNEGYLQQSDMAALLTTLGAGAGGVLALAGYVAGAASGPVYLHWEDRWDQTQLLASKMRNTPGWYLWYNNTGHSIHNERPMEFATDVVNFLARSDSGPTPLGQWGPYSPLPPRADVEACHPATLIMPNPALLDNPAAAAKLLEDAHLGGNFSDNSSPGTYGLRLARDLRIAAAGKDPKQDLANATLAFYSRDPDRSKAYADLAVTGRDAYAAFRRNPPTWATVAASVANTVPGPQEPQFLQCKTSCMKCSVSGVTGKVPSNPPVTCAGNNTTCTATCLKQYPGAFLSAQTDQALGTAVQNAVTRAYQVAWALHRSDIPASYQLRNSLGWIAVSGEDDPPIRPVNVPSGLPVVSPSTGQQVSSYPQFDFDVWMCPLLDPSGQNFAPPFEPYSCQQGAPGAVPFTIRYSIASLTPPPPPQAAAAAPAVSLAPTLMAPVTAAPLVAPATSAAAIQAAVLAASVCLTSDGKTCLAAGAAMPAMGQKRAAIVTVTSAGHAAAGATVSVSAQSVTAVTNAAGVAVVSYSGCVVTVAKPAGAAVASPAPCQGVVSMSGYPSISVGLP